MKKNSPLAAYKTARTNLWILLALSAVNVLFALLGSDTYFLFSCFISYLVAIYARVFYDYTWAPVYLVIGILIALVILVVYLLCCLLSKRGVAGSSPPWCCSPWTPPPCSFTMSSSCP